MKKILIQYKRGFTLVELMVVVSVIAILSSIVYANFGEARKAARDDTRKAALKEVQLAIELYKAQNGEYPDRCPSGTTWSGSVVGTAKCTDGTTEYIKGLVPDFIAELPVDPNAKNLTGNAGYVYYVRNVGGKNTEYKLMADGSVESKFITSYNDEFARCPHAALTETPANSACPFGSTKPAHFRSYAVYKGDVVQMY